MWQEIGSVPQTDYTPLDQEVEWMIHVTARFVPILVVCHRRGIMVRMEKPQLDKTTPENQGVEQTQASSPGTGETRQVELNDPSTTQVDLGQTIPASLAEAGKAASDSEATVPISTQLEMDQAGDMGETMPTPVRMDAEIPPEFEATIPPPPTTDGDGGLAVPEGGEGPAQPKRHRLRLAIIAGIIGLVLIALLSGFGGYFSGINLRTQAEETQKAGQVQEQLELAAQDIMNKDYYRARQRLEYIVHIDPEYPGAKDMLAEVLLQMSITASPTPVPSPTLTPTPDMRGADEIFNQSQQSLFQSDWNTTVNSLLTLRKKEPDYKPIQVDDMLYTAYLNRGKDKILKSADLEGGIYDLTIAERFGPLDADSKSYQTWARLYILGASFWDVDWSQVVYYFGQVAPALPNLRDGSGWTATERYRLGLANYGNYLAARREWCAAMQNYQQALAYGADSGVQQSYNTALEKCEGPKKTEAAPTEGVPPIEQTATP
jgi:hypothetical protein